MTKSKCVQCFITQARWRGTLHHVTNKHEWVLGDAAGPAACDHGLIEEQTKPWLEAGSKEHQRLRELLLNKRLLGNLKYYVNFRFVLVFFMFKPLSLKTNKKTSSCESSFPYYYKYYY